MHLKKGNENVFKIMAESSVICDLKNKMEQREKELNDLRNYVKVLEELFQRTRQQQYFIPIDSTTIIEGTRPSHN